MNKKKNNNKNEQKIQLNISVHFMHTTDKEKSRTFHIKSDNIEITSGSNTDNDITKFLNSFIDNYGKEEQILRNSSNYSFESVDLSGIHFHNIKLKRGSSYIDSPTWIKNKHATINPKNTKDNECLKYAILAALHHKEMKYNPKRISKLKPYANN